MAQWLGFDKIELASRLGCEEDSMFNAMNKKSRAIWVAFLLGWLLGAGGMVVMALDWASYQAVGLSVGCLFLGAVGGYAVGCAIETVLNRFMKRRRENGAG